MAGIADYKMLKLLEETEYAKYFTAERENGTYLVNLFSERGIIRLYMPVFAGISSQTVPSLSEWFSENAKLYTVFKYEEGLPVSKYLEKERPPSEYRMLMLKNVAFKLSELASAPPLIQRTIVEPENIVLVEGELLFNYKIPAHLEHIKQDDVYRAISDLMDVFFPNGEAYKNTGLRVISDKCDKFIYASFAELIRDIDALLKRQENELDLKAAILQKNKKRIVLARSVFAALCLTLAVMFICYEYIIKSRYDMPTFAPVELIGTVRVDSPTVSDAETENKAETVTVHVYGQKLEVEIPVIKPVESVPVELPGELPQPLDESEPVQVYETYKVVPGDNLTKICRKHYGAITMVYKLAEYNQIRNPNLLIPGQELILPPAELFETTNR